VCTARRAYRRKRTLLAPLKPRTLPHASGGDNEGQAWNTIDTDGFSHKPDVGTMTEHIRVGEHSLHIEAPDVFVIVIRGDVDEGQAVAVCEAMVAFAKGKKYVLFLCDLTDMGDISQTVRQTFADYSRLGPPRGTALFGGSFRVRILVDIVTRVSNLFSRRYRQVRFVGTEAEARACLEELRRSFRNR